jgi:hypothetical protein
MRETAVEVSNPVRVAVSISWVNREPVGDSVAIRLFSLGGVNGRTAKNLLLFMLEAFRQNV